jgi:hypothetical protein
VERYDRLPIAARASDARGASHNNARRERRARGATDRRLGDVRDRLCSARLGMRLAGAVPSAMGHPVGDVVRQARDPCQTHLRFCRSRRSVRVRIRQGHLVGSDIATTERGTHTLKGVPDYWRLFAIGDLNLRAPIRLRHPCPRTPIHESAPGCSVRQLADANCPIVPCFGRRKLALTEAA